MKKSALLVCSLACLTLVAPLAGCGESSAPASVTSSATSVDPLVTAAQQAALLLNYSAQAVPGMTSRKVILTYKLEVPGYEFTVDYTIVDKTTYKGSSATLTQDPDPDVVTPWTLTCTAAIKDVSETNPYYLGILTAHVKYQGTEYATRDFNIRIDYVAPVKIKAISGCNSGDNIVTFGYVVGTYSGTKDYLWVCDGDAGVCAYGPSAQFAVGTFVKIQGTYGPYNGLVEFSKGCTVTQADPADPLAEGVVAAVALTWDGTYKLQNKDQSRPITAAGTIASASTSSSGSVTAVLTVGSTKITVYADKSKISATQLAAAVALKVGDSVSVSGFLGYYNNKDAALAWQIISPTITVA